jgi:hypothetical protein
VRFEAINWRYDANRYGKQKVALLLKKLLNQVHNLELLDELHDHHHTVYDPPRQPRTFAETLDWFASESVPDTTFK